MTNFNEQTGELRVNDVLTTTFNKQTGEIKITNSTSSQTEISKKWKEYQDWLNEVPEISDEEIEKEGWKYCYENKISSTNIVHWITACKWYREQLKKK